MHLIFYKTHDVFLAEEKLNDKNIKSEILPTPVQDKAYCGICLGIDARVESEVARVLASLEYKVIK